MRQVAPPLLLILLCASLPACGSRSALLPPGAEQPADAARPADAAVDRSRPDLGLADATGTLVERALRGCVLAASCTPPDPGGWQAYSASSCLDELGRLDSPGTGYYFGPSTVLAERLLKCSEGASGNCRAFNECFGGSWGGLRPCREGATCSGGQLVTPGNAELSLSCSTFGLPCVELLTGAQRACCAEACGGPDWASCNGGRGQRCVAGAVMGYECDPLSQVCTEDPQVLCQGTGTPCSDATPPSCEGSRVSYCAGGRMATLECGGNPFRSGCGTASSGLPCAPGGKECGPDFADECAGSEELVVCLDGRKTKVSCRELGFEICYPNDRPARCGWLL